ncbi:MAG TPA: transcription termination/antitermination NusG family protein [Bryobacteraceae bacterium]
MPWFALRVRSRAEQLVGGSLSGKGYEVFLPTYLECRRYSSCVKKVDAALFPGYLFCRLNVNQRLPVLSTRGVEHIVSCAGVPRFVPDSEIAAIRTVVEAQLPAIPWPYLRLGTAVRIEFGPLAGLEGLVVLEKSRERLVLSVHLLQRSVSVEIERSWVRPLGSVPLAVLPDPAPIICI